MSIRKAYAVFCVDFGTFHDGGGRRSDGITPAGVPESVIYPTIALGCLICALVQVGLRKRTMPVAVRRNQRPHSATWGKATMKQ
jgi:hypothetical protein